MRVPTLAQREEPSGREQHDLVTHALGLALLLLSNIAPALLSLMNKRWDLAPLVYCGGNTVWICRGLRPRVSIERDHQGSASVWMPCLLMTLGALAWAWVSQPPVTLNNGLGFDGLHYAAIYSYFSRGAYFPIEPQFPYAQRVGMPFLAAQIPLSPRQSFFLLHAIFWSMTMVVFAISCQKYFDLSAPWIHFGVMWLQIHWISVPRATASYTFTVDSAALFFMQTWIFLLVCRRWQWLLPVCAFVGVLFKETILLLVLVSLSAVIGLLVIPRFRRTFPKDLWPARSKTVVVLILAAAAAGLGHSVALRILPHAQPGAGSALHTVWQWVVVRVGDPVQVLRYVTAVFAAYGGFALIGVTAFGRSGLRRMPWTVTLATALCPLYFAVCFVAGSDLTKFAYMAFPFALPILLWCCEWTAPGVVIVALLLGLPAAHTFTPIMSPLAGHLVPSQDLQGPYSWMMEYAHPALVGSWMAWWLAGIMVISYFRRRSDADSHRRVRV